MESKGRMLISFYQNRTMQTNCLVTVSYDFPIFERFYIYCESDLSVSYVFIGEPMKELEP